jgi:hypothetical protein
MDKAIQLSPELSRAALRKYWTDFDSFCFVFRILNCFSFVHTQLCCIDIPFHDVSNSWFDLRKVSNLRDRKFGSPPGALSCPSTCADSPERALDSLNMKSVSDPAYSCTVSHVGEANLTYENIS